MTSGRLIAQAATLIRSSPSLGSGTARVTIFITFRLIHVENATSGGPYLVMSTHFIVAGMVEKQRRASRYLEQRDGITGKIRTGHKSGEHGSREWIMWIERKRIPTNQGYNHFT